MVYSFNATRIKTILWCTAFSVLLWWVYANQIAPALEIEKIYYNSCSPLEDLLCLILAIAPSFMLPTEVTKPSHFTWWMLYITVTAPTAVVAPHVLNSRSNVWPLTIAVILCSMIVIPVSNWKPLKLPRLTISPFAFWMIALVFTIITFVALYAAYGMPNTALSFSTAENLRAAFKEKNKDVPMIVRYLFRWEGNVIGPLCVSYGIVHRKYLLVIAGCVIEQLIFMFTTLREFDLVPILLFGVALWYFNTRFNAGKTFISSITWVSAFFSSLFFVKDTPIISLAYFDRFLLVGGQHTAMFYEYFTTHSPALMGASFGKFIWNPPPYDQDVGLVIGAAYFRIGSSTKVTNATAHFWADAFGNFQWPGVIVTTIVCMLLFWVMDSAYTKIDRRITIMMTVMMALSINGQGLHTSILTGGVLPMIVVGLVGGRVLAPVPIPEKKKRRFRWKTPVGEAPALKPATGTE